MAERREYDGVAWIQGGTARIPARGEPGGGPIMVDDTSPEIKEHLKREAYKDGLFYGVENLVNIYGAHQPALAKERNATTLAGAKGLTERTLEAYDADVLTAAEAAPTDDALDLRRAFGEYWQGIVNSLAHRPAHTPKLDNSLIGDLC